jgi:hypothetical protein
MNTPEYYPGASYRVELPGGEFVQLFAGSHFATHLGRVEFPAGESFGVIELDCTNVGGFKFAGLAHDTPVPGRICEWSQAGGWQFYPGPLASPVCYDAQGKLHYEPIPASDGGWSSQGYRYSDESRVYTGDETYALPALGIWEYSRVHGIAVGQGHEGGVHVAGPDNVRRVLGDDNCIRVKPRTDGVRVVVSGWAATVNRCVTWRGMLSDLLTLPPYVVSAPPVTPIPPIVTPNPPKPESKPMPTVPSAEIERAKAMLATVRGERAFGPNQEPLPYIKAVAQRLGYPWGLNGKRGDANNPSGDILAYDFPSQQPQLYDTLGDAGGSNTPTFSPLDYPQPAGAVFIRVDSAAPPVPGTPPSPTSTGPGGQIDAELAALLKRLVTLENKVAEVAARPVVTTPPPTGLSGRIALKTFDGHYLCAEGGGGGTINATRDAVGGWETFTIIEVD